MGSNSLTRNESYFIFRSTGYLILTSMALEKYIYFDTTRSLGREKEDFLECLQELPSACLAQSIAELWHCRR